VPPERLAREATTMGSLGVPSRVISRGSMKKGSLASSLESSSIRSMPVAWSRSDGLLALVTHQQHACWWLTLHPQVIPGPVRAVSREFQCFRLESTWIKGGPADLRRAETAKVRLVTRGRHNALDNILDISVSSQVRRCIPTRKELRDNLGLPQAINRTTDRSSLLRKTRRQPQRLAYSPS
jgi:hypothetical protein